MIPKDFHNTSNNLVYMVELKELEEFVIQIQQLIKEQPDLSERQARQYIFDEFLRLLKWNHQIPVL